MAKAPFWLRGGKGKLAGSVLFKGERGTIVRENVTPHNPQTGGMMRQRALFATVTQAAKLMLPIIGISFEGVSEGKLNRRKFVQLNTTYLGNIARNILTTGTNPRGMAFSAKGNNQLIPNPYVVSRGSLKLPHQELAIINDGGIPTAGTITASIPFGSYTPLQLWSIIFGFTPGAQFTVPYIDFSNNPASKYAMLITDEAGNDIDGIRYAQFHAPRVVLSTEDGAAITINAQTTAEALETAMATVTVSEKTDVALRGYLCSFNVGTEDNNLTVQAQPDYDGVLNVAGRTVGAAGVIYSEMDDNGAWKYTNSQMVTFHQQNFKTTQGGYNSAYFGLKLENAINTFRKTSTTDKNYLQTGGEGGNL